MKVQENFKTEHKSLKATVYYIGGFFGHNSIEIRLHESGYREYAQYPSVPYIVYTQKNCRTKKMMLKGYEPYIVVVEGWGHDKLSVFHTEKVTGLGTVQTGKYSSCDSRWSSDLDLFLNEKIENGSMKTLFDSRKEN